MASWRESVGRIAQNAVTKSREMAEITKLNVEISNLEQKIKENYIQLGQYVLEHPKLISTEDETFTQIQQTVGELQTKIEMDQQNILNIKNVNICPSCGAEVNRSSKFCDKCGTAMDRSILELQETKSFCPNCGAEVESGSAFCGSCGTKLGE